MNAPLDSQAPDTSLPFRKMHGLGNDFVVLDARRHPIRLSSTAARAIADRRTGVGCDQIMIIERPRSGGDAFLAIRNADGSEVESCGNGTRCVARLLLDETGKDELTLETLGGPVSAKRAGELISVDMGTARLDWQNIPLARAVDTLHLPVAEGALSDPVAVSMGNPHAVFFVDDASRIDLAGLGPVIEHHPLFPQRTNVEAVQVMDRRRLRMRVWERGAGITRACGTGACAAVVAAARRGAAERTATVMLDGGNLEIDWRQDGHVIMTGPVMETFRGTINPGLLA